MTTAWILFLALHSYNYNTTSVRVRVYILFPLIIYTVFFEIIINFLYKNKFKEKKCKMNFDAIITFYKENETFYYDVRTDDYSPYLCCMNANSMSMY